MPDDLPTAFFEPDGDTMVGTGWTAGPWDARLMHFGPPAALLGRALRGVLPDDGVARRFVRCAYDILAPVPVAPLTTAARVERPGRRVTLLSAVLRGPDGADLAVARAWVLREEPQDLPVHTPEPPRPPGDPESLPDNAFFPSLGTPPHYGAAFQLRGPGGAFVTGVGDAIVWMRTEIPLVAGEPLDPLLRTLLVADSGNGVSAWMDPREWLFINPDLTVHLHRLPEGEWIALDARTVLHRDGIGQATTGLADGTGTFGHALQSLLVEPQRRQDA